MLAHSYAIFSLINEASDGGSVCGVCVLDECRTLHKFPLALAANAERASRGPPSLPRGLVGPLSALSGYDWVVSN